MRVYVAGINGMVGSALAIEAKSRGYEVLGRFSSELDFRDREATFTELSKVKPDLVLIAAAVVGGIIANSEKPVDFLSQNLQIQTNLIDAAHYADIENLGFLGSSCIYPKYAEQPIHESSLMTGPLEITNESYAIAKIAGIKLVQAYRKQYKRKWISINPSNLYGPKDNFDLKNSHVLPALIRKIHDAKSKGHETIRLWGDGTPIREFLHVTDLSKGVFQIIDEYNEDEPINIGTGFGISIMDLALLVSKIIGFEGQIIFDSSFPNGTPKKVLDISKILKLGWKYSISLETGIAETYRWYLDNKNLELGGKT